MASAKQILAKFVLVFVLLLAVPYLLLGQEQITDIPEPDRDIDTTFMDWKLEFDEVVPPDTVQAIQYIERVVEQQDSVERASRYYPLGPKDKLRLVFYDRRDFEDDGRPVDVVVQDDGTIFVPLIGNVVAGGRTPVELEQLIRTKLDRYIIAPVVLVRIMDYVSHNATLLGAFVHQGIYPLPRPQLLTDFVADHGGLLPEAETREIWVLRNTGERILIDLESYYNLGDVSQDILLINGDQVYAHPVGETFLVKAVRIAQVAVLVLQVVTLTILLTR